MEGSKNHRTNRIDTTRSRKTCSSCSRVNPSPRREPAIDARIGSECGGGSGRQITRKARTRSSPSSISSVSRKCFTTPLNCSEAVLVENVEGFNTRRMKRQKVASARGGQSTVAALSPYPSSCRIHTPGRGLFKLHQVSLSGLGSVKNATERVGDSTSRLSTPDLAVDRYAGALAITVELEPEASSLYQSVPT